MRFETSQHLRLGQQMKLAPRMIQSMEILQMPLAELQERIQQELESNPTLELREIEPEGESGGGAETADGAAQGEGVLDVGNSGASEDFARLESFEEENPEAAENEFEESGRGEAFDPRTRERALTSEGEFSGGNASGERDAKMDAMMATPARSASLTEQLLDQWRLVEVEPALRPMGEAIITFLDNDGYLRSPLDLVAARAGLPPAEPSEWERALAAVQLFLEPAGVAARDARECLLLQIDALAEDAEEQGVTLEPEVAQHARLLVEHHLDDLLQNRLPRVAERTHLALPQIRAALELMKRLSLAPARRLSPDELTAIVPDAIIEYDADADRYLAYLNESRMPNLRVNQEYARLAKDKTAAARDRDFVKTNLSNAQWLIDAVQQRKHTLLRVLRAVVEAQRDYFDFGPQALKPLPMTQVAEQLGIHVATVSRAVSDKWVQTPRGVVALRKFFSGGLQTDGGGDMAWDAIKAALQEVIGAEDKRKPLSDEALVDELKKRGIEIARRTVAKYRDQLQIPPARLRKQF